MGAWGMRPFENDSSGDYVLDPLRQLINKGLANENYEVARAAGALLLATATLISWDNTIAEDAYTRLALAEQRRHHENMDDYISRWLPKDQAKIRTQLNTEVAAIDALAKKALRRRRR